MILEKKDVISVWMGTTEKSIEEFGKYTENMEILDSNCPAHKDWGVELIDPDMFIAYITYNHQVIAIEDLAEETSANSTTTLKEIIEKAKSLGVHYGNALYCYEHHEFIENSKNKTYNDLKFIGSFNNQRTRKSGQ